MSRLIIFIFIISIIGFVYYSFEGGQSGEGYVKEIIQNREEKDNIMVTQGYPFEGRSDEFQGLKYYDPDPSYRISARLEPVKSKSVLRLSTNDGLETPYFEYAYADFTMEGASCRLLILEVMESGPNRGSLFLAFADETSARETYGAGRYLDISKVPGSSSVLLDFNKAYNPYCAYSDNYSCPFPPRENILNVPIRAGEKVYH